MTVRTRTDRFDWIRDAPARPLSIAHRGASAWAPDNSLRAFRYAALLGADFWEVDVRGARDGALVAAHDPEVVGLDGRRHAVAAHACPDLAALTGGAVASLDEVLALAAATGTGIYVDAKDDVAVERVPGRLREHGIRRAAIAAFSSERLRELAGRDTGYPLAVLVGRDADPLAAAARSGADIVHLTHAWAASATPPWRVGTSTLARLRERGLPVVLWHEECPERAAAMLALPVLGVCSNRPEVLRRYVASPEAGRPAIVCAAGASWIAPRGTSGVAHAALGAGYGVAVDAGTADGDGAPDGLPPGGGPTALDDALALAARYDGELHVELSGGEIRAADAVRRVRAAGRIDRCVFRGPGPAGLEALGSLPRGARTLVRRRDFPTLAAALDFPGDGFVELDAPERDRDAAAGNRGTRRRLAVGGADVVALAGALGPDVALATLDRPHALRRLLEPDWPGGEAERPLQEAAGAGAQANSAGSTSKKPGGRSA